jgi:alkylation response protein AidB-like acyl-CoA dehydrogenase
MFTFMNTARIGTAVQGVPTPKLSYQGALPYAKERRSMRALSGKKEPDKVIRRRLIWHADVRRMLLTQKGHRRRRPRHDLCAARQPTT